MDIQNVTWEVLIDWDCTDWTSPGFSEPEDDISLDVKSVLLVKGKDNEAGNIPASTWEVRIIPGLCNKYSPFGSGTLGTRVSPWLPIRARAFFNSTYYPIFAGFISKLTIDPHLDKQIVTLYCTDGVDLLARQEIAEDWDNRTDKTEGEAVGSILDAAGWSSTNRDLDPGQTINYPTVSIV